MSFKDIIKYRNIWMGLAILWTIFYHAEIWPAGDFLTWIKTIGYGGVDIFLFASGISLEVWCILLYCFLFNL